MPSVQEEKIFCTPETKLMDLPFSQSRFGRCTKHSPRISDNRLYIPARQYKSRWHEANGQKSIKE